ncbi:MAG: hydantoinase B/oxoprolinase family protein [Planctomycetes bacterium]|nr:hydantoinase B/oxoprolinase family protein [Planctomycetota bacterium]
MRKQGDQLSVDFTGTSLQVESSWNTHQAVATSAIFYVLQSLSPDQIPETSGTLEAVQMTFPDRSLVSSCVPAGVAIGNVETSQRIVDVLLEALRQVLPQQIPACSQGTMNNLLFGGRRADGTPFVYYETLGGGAGANIDADGASAVQVHMTNTRNTPVEVFELELPVRVHQLKIRRKSGGIGLHRGGDGLIKEIEFLEPARVTLAGTRRQSGAPGASGGSAGMPGIEHVQISGTSSWKKLKPGQAIDVAPGDRIRVQTPGGGGWGPAEKH